MRWKKPIIAWAFVVLGLCVGCDKTLHIDGVSPGRGKIAGGDEVLIKGDGFQSGMNVYWNSAAVTELTVEGPEQVRVKTPAGSPGVVDVIVKLSSGEVYVRKNAFEYLDN